MIDDWSFWFAVFIGTCLMVEIIKNLCNLSKVEIATDIEKPSQSATAVIKNMEIFATLSMCH